MTESGKRVAYAVGGAIAGALLLWGASEFLGSDDEDRPPIIVKNGSLVFQSGTEPRPGKSWKAQGNRNWQTNHGNGKRVSTFQLYFIGGKVKDSDDPCRPTTATDFTVKLDHDGNSATDPIDYQVTRRPDGKKAAPTVIGDNLTPDTTDSTKLVAPSTNGGMIASVVVPDFECQNPQEVWVESIK
jgi:hypothetical protein